MPSFDYVARNRDGVLMQRRIEGESAEAVATQLVESGVTPIRIQPTGARGAAGDLLSWELGKQKVSLEDLISFTRQMATLTHAGLPIVGAIRGLAGGARNPTMAEALLEVASSLEAGRELSGAFQQHSKLFSTLYVSVVNVGENTGRLDEAFEELSHYLELEQDTRRRIKSATRYPTMVFGAIVAAMFLINIFVLPAFTDSFRRMGSELPWATQMLVLSSDLTLNYWPHMLIGLVGGWLGLRAYIQTPMGRFQWHRIKLRIPLVGSIILRSTLARYARTFAMTSKSGLPVNRTLEIVARAVDNEYVGQRIAAMHQAIQRGESLLYASNACGLFPPVVLQMIAVGEQSGTLEEMHRHIAISYEREVDYDLKRMSDMIEPILICAVGGIVLILALGIYLPMWEFGG